MRPYMHTFYVLEKSLRGTCRETIVCLSIIYVTTQSFNYLTEKANVSSMVRVFDASR